MNGVLKCYDSKTSPANEVLTWPVVIFIADVEFSPEFIYGVHVSLNGATAGGPPPITKVSQPGGVGVREL